MATPPGGGGLKKAALFLQGNSDKDRFNTVLNDINKVFDLLRWSGDFPVDHILPTIFLDVPNVIPTVKQHRSVSVGHLHAQSRF